MHPRSPHPPSSMHQGIVDVAQACPNLEVLCVTIRLCEGDSNFDPYLKALSTHTGRLVELNLVMVSGLGKISIISLVSGKPLGCPLHQFIHSNQD